MQNGPSNSRYFALVYKFPVTEVGSSSHVAMDEVLAVIEVMVSLIHTNLGCFQVSGIPSLLKRPPEGGHGTIGTTIALRANFKEIRIRGRLQIYMYDVKIETLFDGKQVVNR